MDPATWYLIGSAAVKFIGGIIAGRGAKKAGQMEQARQHYNSQIALLQAEDAEQRGAQAVSEQRMQTRQLIGTQRAGYSGQNVDVNVGSAVDVQADAAMLGELDAQKIAANAEREAWGYRVEAVDRYMAGNIARQGGNSAGNAAYFNAAGSFMTDVGLAVEKYGEKKRTNPNPPGRK